MADTRPDKRRPASEKQKGAGHPATYNRIAGQSVERISALSDGLFAIAMTLIVVEIHVPEAAKVHSEGDLWQALIALGPRILMYLMSFLTLGIFWVGQQTQLNHLKRADRDLAWIHLGFLATVATLLHALRVLCIKLTPNYATRHHAAVFNQ
jgi:Endosomal/lysosomal potassium channel TMEM175